MNELFKIGLSENEVKSMLEQVPNIIDMSDEEVNSKIEILKCVECVNRHIKNIIVSNPYYLDRSNSDLLTLIKYLMEIGFSNLNLLFDSNPYFLNYDAFEIRDYIDKKVNSGMLLDDIVSDIMDNPYIIDEE